MRLKYGFSSIIQKLKKKKKKKTSSSRCVSSGIVRHQSNSEDKCGKDGVQYWVKLEDVCTVQYFSTSMTVSSSSVLIQQTPTKSFQMVLIEQGQRLVRLLPGVQQSTLASVTGPEVPPGIRGSTGLLQYLPQRYLLLSTTTVTAVNFTLVLLEQYYSIVVVLQCRSSIIVLQQYYTVAVV